MAGVHELTPVLGASGACKAMGLWRGAPQRQRARAHRQSMVGPQRPRAARPSPPLALDASEREVLLDTLNSDRFVDTAPAAVHATLLDEGRYLGSVRTMYRLLQATQSSSERRNQLNHPVYTKPELLAVAPNQVWSWDNTQAQGASQVDVLSPVRDFGHLQPFRRGLVDRPTRECRAGSTAYCRHRGAP